MNISYEKSKSLKDIETKFKKYPRTKKNRSIIHIIDLFHNRSISQVNGSISQVIPIRTPYNWYTLFLL